jgi:predicted O-methyltransferase YrrM
LLGADPEALKTWLRGGQAHDTFTVGLIDRTEQKEYDVIIVDHGPQLQTRADDVPWLVSQLAPEGIMLFDDWRPKHEGRIRRALAAVGGNWEIGMGPDTKRTLRDKGIGYAWRA